MPFTYAWLRQNATGLWTTPGVASAAPGDLPTVNAFSNFTPDSGPEATEVVITGSNFTGATAVTFDGTTATFSVDSDTQITTTAPVGATTGRITIVTPVGPVTTADAYTVTATPDPDPDPDPDPIPDPEGFIEVWDEQFTGGELDPVYWHVYDESTFGAPTRIQTYLAANVVVGTGSDGSTGGTSLKLLSDEVDAGSGTGPTSGNAGTRYTYTAGMLDTKTADFFLPRYCRVIFRCKTPHGQGLWPAFWLTAKTGGATMAELDVLEYFHSQVPGKNSITLHGTAGTTSTSGTFHANRYTNNVGGRTFFEAPTATPGWHVWSVTIRPVTDAGGLTYAYYGAPSNFVEYVFLVDGVQKFRFVDTAAMYYTSNGGDQYHFWQIYLQGCQVDGDYVGHPRSPLGYSHWRNACLSGGTAPSSCTTTIGGYSVRAPTFSDPGSTLEVDYVHVDKYTG